MSLQPCSKRIQWMCVLWFPRIDYYSQVAECHLTQSFKQVLRSCWVGGEQGPSLRSFICGWNIGHTCCLHEGTVVGLEAQPLLECGYARKVREVFVLHVINSCTTSLRFMVYSQAPHGDKYQLSQNINSVKDPLQFPETPWSSTARCCPLLITPNHHDHRSWTHY